MGDIDNSYGKLTTALGEAYLQEPLSQARIDSLLESPAFKGKQAIAIEDAVSASYSDKTRPKSTFLNTEGLVVGGKCYLVVEKTKDAFNSASVIAHYRVDPSNSEPPPLQPVDELTMQKNAKLVLDRILASDDVGACIAFNKVPPVQYDAMLGKVVEESKSLPPAVEKEIYGPLQLIDRNEGTNKYKSIVQNINGKIVPHLTVNFLTDSTASSATGTSTADQLADKPPAPKPGK